MKAGAGNTKQESEQVADPVAEENPQETPQAEPIVTEVKAENRNCVSPAIDFLVRCANVVASWIAGDPPAKPVDKPEPEGNNPHPPSGKGRTLGFILSILGLVLLFPSFLLNRMAAGTVFPYSESFDLHIFGGILTMEPQALFAFGMTFCTAAMGIVALESKFRFANRNARSRTSGSRTRKPAKPNMQLQIQPRELLYFAILIVLVLGSAFMAAYRTFVLNGNRFDWNVPGVLLITLVIEAGLAIISSLGFRQFIEPIGDNGFSWAQDNWRYVRQGFRFIFGFVALVLLTILLGLCYICYAIVWLIVTGIPRAVKWLWRKWSEWKAGADERARIKKKRYEDWVEGNIRREEDRQKAILAAIEARKKKELAKFAADKEVADVKRLERERRGSWLKRLLTGSQD